MATGKRAGSRRGTTQRTRLSRPALGFALAITTCLIAWGYLVYLAIDFGTAARFGDAGAWGLLVLSSLGAVACLFAALLFVSRLLRTLGIVRSLDEPPALSDVPTSSSSPRPSGRVARTASHRGGS